jgi:hypothetical protein
VNNEARLVCIASTHWDFKIYSRELGFQGMRLSALEQGRRSVEVDKISVCLQLAPGFGNSSAFYSLRAEMKDGAKVVKVYKMRRQAQSQFEEESFPVEDSTARLLIPRVGGNNFCLFGEKYAYCWSKGKVTQLKMAQPKASMPVTWWRRTLRDRSEQYFIVNEHGELLITCF